MTSRAATCPVEEVEVEVEDRQDEYHQDHPDPNPRHQSTRA